MPATATPVKEIAFMGYPVKDMARARKFYEEIMGLKPEEVDPNGTFTEYDLNGVAFSLGRFDGWEPSTSGPSVAFEMDNFEQTVAMLKKENVAFQMEPIETPVCFMASIEDTEGNSLLIHKRKA